MSVKRIRKIDPVQTGKVTAIIAVVLLYIVFVPIAIFMMLIPSLGDDMFSGVIMGSSIAFLLIVPIIYGVFGFLMGMLYAFIYNKTFSLHGGIQYEFEDIDDDVARIAEHVA